MVDLNYLYLASLVRRAQVNDSDAFAEIYALTYKKQYNYACHYLRDEYLAQDVVQDIYVHVLKHINDIKDPNLFIAWLNQITFHMCFDCCRKKDRNYGEINPEVLELAEDIYKDHNPEAAAEGKDENIRLKEAINMLSPSEQQVIALRYFNNMQLDEISETTGMSRSTVKRKINTAKEDQKRMLE